jgi:DNA end-binding protein Ku
VPSSESNKPYRLLADVMERENKAGIATAVMRDKEYLLAITANRGVLTAQVLRFAAELRQPADVGLGKRRAPADGEVRSFARAIDDLAKPGVAERELVDQRVERFRALVERKRKSGDDVVEVQQEEAALAAEEEPSEEDLFETIRRSLTETRERPASRRGSTRARTAPRRDRTPSHRNAARRTASRARSARR